MKQAWMPIAALAAIAGSIWLTGCDTGALGTAWTSRERSPRPARITSDPVSHQPAARARANEPDTPGQEANLLAVQVQNFLARLSPGAQSAVQPGAAADSASAAVPPPPPGFARNAPRLGMVAPLEPTRRFTLDEPRVPTSAPAAAAMSATPAQVEPAVLDPRRSEAAASPARPVGPAPSPAPASPGAATPALTTPAPVPAAAVHPTVEILEVRAVSTPPPDSQPAASGANQPVTAASPAPVDSVEALIARLEAALKLQPRQIDEQLTLRLLYAATGQDDRAAGPLEGVDPVQGELIAAVLRTVLATRDSMHDPVNRSAAAIAAAEHLRRLLGHQSPVIIPRLALVTRVNSYGDYDAVDPPRFPAGQPVHVFLYTEVKNFRSEATDDDRLRTVLAEKVEVFDASGKVVWQRSEPTIEDRSISPRMDFFMTMEIQLPADLPAGEYVLKVTVEDKLGATTDQQRLSFLIDSQ